MGELAYVPRDILVMILPINQNKNKVAMKTNDAYTQPHVKESNQQIFEVTCKDITTKYLVHTCIYVCVHAEKVSMYAEKHGSIILGSSNELITLTASTSTMRNRPSG